MPVGRLIGEFQTIRQLLGGAELMANESGETLPGPEHLLLSALALPDGTARRAFERLGADPDGLEAAIAAQHDDALRAVGIQVDADGPVVAAPQARGVFNSTPSAQAAFRRAVELSKSPKPRRLQGAHVVLAVTEIERGTVVRALDRMGVNREELAAAAREELATALSGDLLPSGHCGVDKCRCYTFRSEPSERRGAHRARGEDRSHDDDRIDAADSPIGSAGRPRTRH